MWDELAAAAWMDPPLITEKEARYMSVDVNQGAAYGNTPTWTDKDNPRPGAQLIEIQGSGSGEIQQNVRDEGTDTTGPLRMPDTNLQTPIRTIYFARRSSRMCYRPEKAA